ERWCVMCRILQRNTTVVCAMTPDQYVRTCRRETHQDHDSQRGTTMHLPCQCCCGRHRKDSPLRRGLLVGICLVLVTASSTFAWSKAGHMVSGAIAYADLQQTSPETLARVIALLKSHPQYQTKWVPRLAQLTLTPEEQDLYLFMLAARLA